MSIELVGLNEARAKGLRYYFTGKPCKYGHIATRLVSTRNCRACLGLKEVRPTPLERFESKYIPVPESGCWLWIGSTTGKYGYGRFSPGKSKLELAHRFAWEYYKGPIPSGLTLDHLCRVSCCVNPDHLEAVSLRENILRGNNVASINAKKTMCCAGHVFDSSTTRKWGFERVCRTCSNERNRRYQEKKRHAAT